MIFENVPGTNNALGNLVKEFVNGYEGGSVNMCIGIYGY